mgnify:CR=1 FL=1
MLGDAEALAVGVVEVVTRATVVLLRVLLAVEANIAADALHLGDRARSTDVARVVLAGQDLHAVTLVQLLVASSAGVCDCGDAAATDLDLKVRDDAADVRCGQVLRRSENRGGLFGEEGKLCGDLLHLREVCRLLANGLLLFGLGLLLRLGLGLGLRALGLGLGDVLVRRRLGGLGGLGGHDLFLYFLSIPLLLNPLYHGFTLFSSSCASDAHLK